jgi:hypothetical protein
MAKIDLRTALYLIKDRGSSDSPEYELVTVMLKELDRLYDIQKFAHETARQFKKDGTIKADYLEKIMELVEKEYGPQ